MGFGSMLGLLLSCCHVNTLRPRQNGRLFADDTFKRIFLNENVRISIKISLKFVPKGPINNNPALVQIMAWRRSGDKPLSEPTMVSLLTQVKVTEYSMGTALGQHHMPRLLAPAYMILMVIIMEKNGAKRCQIINKWHVPKCYVMLFIGDYCLCFFE